MKHAVITLNGIAAIDKPKTIKQVNFTDEKTLIAHLKELQAGYRLDGKDKVKIEKHQIPSNKYPGKTRMVIDASSYADWHHVAHIGVSLVPGSSYPIETI